MIMLNKGCPYCGQVLAIQIKDDATEAEIREAVVKQCICEQAERHKELANARKNIRELFGEESLKKFDDSFNIEVQEDLIDWAKKVYDEMYEKIVITMENGDKATIAASGKRIKISREQKVKVGK
jgi:hypothetical protein